MPVCKLLSFTVCCIAIHLHIQAQGIGSQTLIDPYDYTCQKDALSAHGLVVCAHPLAAKVGLDILKQGGNAIDAAIATQLALAVVYPGAGNLGGGGFMVATAGKNRIALDFRETASAGACAEWYEDGTGHPVMSRLQEGAMASGVPGTVAGIFAAMKYATFPISKLIQPAIDLAEKGFTITKNEATALDSAREAFVRNNKTAPVFVKPGNGWWSAGDTLVQKELAATLVRIREYGRDGFYKGETARMIAETMQLHGGKLTRSDLRNYKVRERIPVTFRYRGYEIVTMPLPGSGGILLQQMLKILEQRPMRQYGFQSVQSVQLMVEAERRAYADRAEYLGDPDFVKVPVRTLVSDAYLKQRMADYDSSKAGKSVDIRAGMIPESEQTTHISIIDKDGNCASITTTLNGQYGSHCIVEGAGFLLNNEMDDFSLQAGVPNQYGALGSTANSIAPGKRMLSSMSPTLVLDKGKPFMVVGTPGGTTIITSVLQSIVNVVDFGMNAHDAVNRPKFHHQWQPDQIDIEAGFPPEVRDQLKAMGYKINSRKPWSRTEMILLKSAGIYEAAADHRGDDAAEGY